LPPAFPPTPRPLVLLPPVPPLFVDLADPDHRRHTRYLVEVTPPKRQPHVASTQNRRKKGKKSGGGGGGSGNDDASYADMPMSPAGGADPGPGGSRTGKMVRPPPTSLPPPPPHIITAPVPGLEPEYEPEILGSEWDDWSGAIAEWPPSSSAPGPGETRILYANYHPESDGDNGDSSLQPFFSALPNDPELLDNLWNSAHDLHTHELPSGVSL
jgi:hypothetical protein